jgi:hypothetical protein
MQGQLNTLTGMTWKEPLAKVDRSTLTGFIRYWSQRPIYFKDFFDADYTERTARRMFKVVKEETFTLPNERRYAR